MIIVIIGYIYVYWFPEMTKYHHRRYIGNIILPKYFCTIYKRFLYRHCLRLFSISVYYVYMTLVGYNIICWIRPYSHPDENLWCVGFHLMYKYMMHIERALGHNICITRLVESIRFEQNCFLQGGQGTRCRSCFPLTDTYMVTCNWSTDPVLQHTLASTRVVKCTYIIMYTNYKVYKYT